MFTKVVVIGLTIDAESHTPVVLLREENSRRVLPIWIGVIEASAIACHLENIKVSRPMTHDLLRATVHTLGGQVKRVDIMGATAKSCVATIRLGQGEKNINLDARPSDALALALRSRAPIYCSVTLLEKKSQRPSEELGSPLDFAPPVKCETAGPRRLRSRRPPLEAPRVEENLLENFEPSDFGKYKM